MDAISLIIALFLEGSCVSTFHLHPQDGHTFRVTIWECQGKPELAVWQRKCPRRDSGDEGWWSRPFLLMRQDGKGFYLNKFGEVMSGLHVDMDDMYLPSCDV